MRSQRYRLERQGETPLTIAFQDNNRRRSFFGESHQETPLEAITKPAKPLHVTDDDFVAAAELGYKDGREMLALLLGVAEDMVVSERVICRILTRSSVDGNIIRLLMQRSGGIGVTVEMLKAVADDHNLENLLKQKTICPITPDILASQRSLKCMEMLLMVDPTTPVTEEVVFQALRIGSGYERRHLRGVTKVKKDVLEILFDRNPGISVTEEMLTKVRYSADMKILLQRLEPSTHISNDVVVAISKLERGEAYWTMHPLLKFNPS